MTFSTYRTHRVQPAKTFREDTSHRAQPYKTFDVNKILSHRGCKKWRHSPKVCSGSGNWTGGSLSIRESLSTLPLVVYDRLAAADLSVLCV